MAQDVKVGNPWLTMWVRPRETVRAIVSSDPKQKFLWLSSLYGFPLLLQFAQASSLGSQVHWGWILVVAALLSVLFGALGILLGSTLLYWTGKWIGGRSHFIEMRAAVSWANVTNLATGFIWVVLAVTFGQSLFMKEFSPTQFMGAERTWGFALLAAQTVLSIWSLIILVKAIGEVQGFSAWKGLLNLLLPIFLVIALAWAIGIFVGCMGAATQV